MKNNITELVFIMDKSGSMAGLEKDTIGGFNAMLNRQREQEGKAYVTTFLFSNRSTMLHDRIDIQNIPPMTEREYQAGGTTALLDTLGEAICHIVNIHRYQRPEDVPEHTIFVITTDGLENASRKYSAEQVRKMIRHEEEKYNWEFIFLGANIDAVKTAEDYGIRRERASNYWASRKGIDAMYCVLDETIGDIRRGKSPRDNWNEKLGEE